MITNSLGEMINTGITLFVQFQQSQSIMEKFKAIILVVSVVHVCLPLICTSLESQMNTTCVYGRHNNDQLGCDIEYNWTDCQRSISIDTLPQLLNSNTTVQFCSSLVILTSELKFTDLRNVEFIGIASQTIIKCTPNAGFKFVSTENLRLMNLVIDRCGARQDSTSGSMNTYTTVVFSTAFFIFNCSNVEMYNLNILESRGTGIAFFDTNGENEFTNCTFGSSEARSLPGGSGVYIEFTYCTPGVRGFCPQTTTKKNKNSLYSFNNCTFSNNYASAENIPDWEFPAQTNFLGLGRGGGMCIYFKGAAMGNTISLSQCTFKENKAMISGGGLYVAFHDCPQDNTLTVIDSVFQHNGNIISAGGGFIGGYLFYNNKPPRGNKMQFQNCTFSENTGRYGGGVVFYSSKSQQVDLYNEMEFFNCTWNMNTALYGSAVDVVAEKTDALSNGFLPTPIFDNCTFVNNFKADDHESDFSAQLGRGAFLATGFTINFQNETTFRNNSGSAVYVTSCILIFIEGSTAIFDSNTGWEGGAIALIGLSAIHVEDDCILVFEKNRCDNKGGAISFFSTDKHDYVISHSCFIQYIGEKESVEERNISITFTQNQAGLREAKDENSTSNNYDDNQHYGHSIHATSLKPCIFACNTDHKAERTIEKTFSCTGDVRFSNISRKYEVSTNGGYFRVNNDTRLPLQVTPGKETPLPIQILDDYNLEVSGAYRVRVDTVNGSTIQVNNAYKYITNKMIQLQGEPKATGTLILSKVGFREIELSMDIVLEQCPPGFVLKSNSCICSLNTDLRYLGVYSCNETSLSVTVQRGFWFGYDFPKMELASDESFRSGYCPPGYCFKGLEKMSQRDLPNEASVRHLDNVVCGTANRTGIICGQCIENHSVFYHSENFGCMPDELCRIGWLFYILAELVPVAILFLIVIIFNISFTSGPVNGFIFYAQMLDSLSTVIGSDFVLYIDGVYEVHRIHQIIYSIFNLDFFNINELSFCLWKGASSLDILTFKLVTVLFAFCLVLLTIWVMNACNLYRKCPCLRTGSTKSSVIHGLSAFLVMCYAQCVKTSFQILTSTKLYEKGLKFQRPVVYWQGNINHLQGSHLFYAIPVIICILTIVLLPPLALIAYPICYKFPALFKLSENNRLSKISPFLKLKPLLDSFQSCFKDEFRFFAGLHFLYRASLLASSYASNLTATYAVIQAQLFSILMIHAIAQPYKKRWHNIVDTFMLFTLALVYTLTQNNFTHSNYISQKENVVRVSSSIEHIIIFLPLLYILGYIIYCIVQKCKTNVCIQTSELRPTEPWANDELPHRLLHEHETQFDNEDYKSFAESIEEPIDPINYTN